MAAPISSKPRAEWVTFMSSFEALYLKALGPQITPGLKAELKKLGINLEHLDPAYPYDTWLAGLSVTAKALYPGKPVPEAYTDMGERLVASYFDTLIGKPLLAVVRLLGPHRTLGRMTKNFRTSNNYSETDLLDRGQGHYELWINEPGDSRFITLGILRRGLQIAGAPQVKVDVLQTDADGTRYDIVLGS